MNLVHEQHFMQAVFSMWCHQSNSFLMNPSQPTLDEHAEFRRKTNSGTLQHSRFVIQRVQNVPTWIEPLEFDWLPNDARQTEIGALHEPYENPDLCFGKYPDEMPTSTLTPDMQKGLLESFQLRLWYLVLHTSLHNPFLNGAEYLNTCLLEERVTYWL